MEYEKKRFSNSKFIYWISLFTSQIKKWKNRSNICWWIYVFITELEYTEDGDIKESILEFEKALGIYLFQQL